MATVGRGIYATSVHEFFDAVRSYDVGRATAVLADDADFQSPWGSATGKEAIGAILTDLTAPSLQRPSFSIANLSGDGHVTTLQVSMSGRFGRAPVAQTWKLLHLHGRLHHIVIQ